MAFETVKWIKFIELDCRADSSASLKVYTEQPGNAVALRATCAIAAGSTRTPVRLRVGGTVKGKLLKLSLEPTGVFVLYGGRVWAREVGAGGGDWRWYPLPVVQTPDAWQAVSLPIEQTPENWIELHLPIEPTPAGWTAVRLPIEPTPEGYLETKLPIEPTPPVGQWAELPVEE